MDRIITVFLLFLLFFNGPLSGLGLESQQSMLFAAGTQQASSTTPKHVILMIGDGMGFEILRAAGMYQNGVTGGLSFEAFPYQAQMSTRSAFGLTTDSAASATAMATGEKVFNGQISLAFPGDGHELRTLLEDERDHGKSTGLVTSSFMTDATPAAFGAHENSRNSSQRIALDYFTRSRPNVLLGGGGNGMTPAMAQAAGYQVVTDRAGLASLASNSAYVSGQFGQEALPFEYDGIGELPHLSEMASTAIKLLENDPDGFFLMIEGGRIDQAEHKNDLRRTIGEVLEFSRTVQIVANWAAQHPDTLIIVLADHETGGVKVLQNNGQGNYPNVSWAKTNHTSANVPVFAQGTYANQISGTIDNTELRSIVWGQRAADMQATRVVLPNSEDGLLYAYLDRRENL